MCDRCREFCHPFRIESAADLKRLIRILQEQAIAPRLMKIISGSLEWEDMMQCVLECNACTQKIELSCETYHGSGGWIKPINVT